MVNEIKRLIFKVNRLKKKYGSLEAINIKKLEIHPGTIYALVGPPGCGKTTLLEILAGYQKQSSGELFFENFAYKTNWFGKVEKHEEIFYNYGFDSFGFRNTVGKVIKTMYGKKSNTIMQRHFSSQKFKNIWGRPVSSLTKGELHWVSMILSIESDPRVLLIDEYGIHITNEMEQEFSLHLKRMNRTLGTTIIVSSPNEDLVKNFASVFIFMDNGHISKIRSKSNRIAKSRRKSRKGNFSNNRKTSKKGSNHKVQKQHKKNDKINKQNNSNDLQSHSRGKTQNKKQQSLIENKRYNHSKNKNRKNNENYSTKPADRQIEKKHFEKKNNYEDSPDKSGNIE